MKLGIKGKVAKTTNILFVPISMVISTGHQDNYLNMENSIVIFCMARSILLDLCIFSGLIDTSMMYRNN